MRIACVVFAMLLALTACLLDIFIGLEEWRILFVFGIATCFMGWMMVEEKPDKGEKS
jgi:hypothetical protein